MCAGGVLGEATRAFAIALALSSRPSFPSSPGSPPRHPTDQLWAQATFVEGSFVSGCLLYELQFAEDRKIIRKSNTAIGQLVSLAMRTSG